MKVKLNFDLLKSILKIKPKSNVENVDKNEENELVRKKLDQ